MTPSIETISGEVVDLLAPDPTTIQLDDIAHHLSRINRFNGATKGKLGLSVAQHSAWVAVYACHASDNVLVGLHGLLHDAAEAYIGDICTPLKSMPGIADTIQPIEARLLEAIYEALELPEPDEQARVWVHAADQRALRREIKARSAEGGMTGYWAGVRAAADDRRHAQAATAADQFYSPDILFDPDNARRLWLQLYRQLRDDAEQCESGVLRFGLDAN